MKTPATQINFLLMYEFGTPAQEMQFFVTLTGIALRATIRCNPDRGKNRRWTIVRVYRLDAEGRPELGIAGESGVVKIEADASGFAEEYPGGTAMLVFARPDGQVYPLITETDENNIVSAVLSSLETEIGGYVEIELQWFVNDAIAKSRAYHGRIRASVGESTEPPSPSPAWADRVFAAGEAVQDALEEIGETIDTELQRAKESGEFTPHYAFSMTENGILEYEEITE